MASPSRSKATPNRIAIAERERDALELRIGGKTYDQIADALGYSERGGAAKAVSRALAATIQEPADELRRLEAERLDALDRVLWPLALDGNLGAVARCLAIMARRAKLFGLDAPPRHAIEVLTTEALEAAMGRLERENAELEAITEAGREQAAWGGGVSARPGSYCSAMRLTSPPSAIKAPTTTTYKPHPTWSI